MVVFGYPARTVEVMKRCKVCDLPNRTEVEALVESKGRAAAGRLGGVSDYLLRMHYANCVGAVKQAEVKPAAKDKAFVEIGAEDGEIYTGALDTPIRDHADVLRLLGVDPNVWRIVDETVRISRWQVSFRDEDGEMQTEWRHALRARITTRYDFTLSPDEFESLRDSIGTCPKPPKVKPGTGVTGFSSWADMQLGKSEGGGVKATLARVEEKLQAYVDLLALQSSLGIKHEALAVWQGGDPAEGCSGNYASQPFTVELNQRQQLVLAIDVFCHIIKTLAPLAPRLDFYTSHSNHGQWTRNGGSKPITGDSDTFDGALADTLERIFKYMPGYEHVHFHTPHDEPVTTGELSGVTVAFAHGHTAPGAADTVMEKWLDGQSRALIYKREQQPRLWITAHSHHFKAVDLGPYWWFQSPSLDGGSKWFTDRTGKWSTPGLLTMLIGEHDERGWSDLAVL